MGSKALPLVVAITVNLLIQQPYFISEESEKKRNYLSGVELNPRYDRLILRASLIQFPEPQNRTPEALKNEDILGLIFQYFDLEPGSQTVAQSRKDLFSAAKTCKAFVEPALDSLWSIVPSLLPLLLLLPSAEIDNDHYVSSILSCQ